MTCVGAKRTAEYIYGGLWICDFRTRKILPAAAAAPSFAHGDENGAQSSSLSLSETLFTHEDGISRPVNSHLTSFTPSRPRGPTLGLTSVNPSPRSSEVPITPNLGDPLPPKAPPVTASSDVPLGRSTPKQYSYDNRSTMSFVSSLLFPKVSPAPHVQLWFLGEPNYKSLIRPQGSWNYHCEFWISVCETVVGTNIQPQPPRGFGLDEENGDPPYTSKTKSVGGRGHIKCRPTSVLRVQNPIARDAPFRDPQILPSYGLTPRGVYPKVLGGTREHPTGE